MFKSFTNIITNAASNLWGIANNLWDSIKEFGGESTYRYDKALIKRYLGVDLEKGEYATYRPRLNLKASFNVNLNQPAPEMNAELVIDPTTESTVYDLLNRLEGEGVQEGIYFFLKIIRGLVQNLKNMHVYAEKKD